MFLGSKFRFFLKTVISIAGSWLAERLLKVKKSLGDDYNVRMLDNMLAFRLILKDLDLWSISWSFCGKKVLLFQIV